MRIPQTSDLSKKIRLESSTPPGLRLLLHLLRVEDAQVVARDNEDLLARARPRELLHLAGGP